MTTAVVLFRYISGEFSLTGWGFVTLWFFLGSGAFLIRKG